MNKFHRIFALIFTGFFLVMWVALPWWKISELERIREAQRERVREAEHEEGNLSRIEIRNASDAHALHWIEENEFRLEGEMYDLVRTEFENGALILFAIHDEKEKEVLEFIAGMNGAESGSLKSRIQAKPLKLALPEFVTQNPDPFPVWVAEEKATPNPTLFTSVCPQPPPGQPPEFS